MCQGGGVVLALLWLCLLVQLQYAERRWGADGAPQRVSRFEQMCMVNTTNCQVKQYRLLAHVRVHPWSGGLYGHNVTLELLM